MTQMITGGRTGGWSFRLLGVEVTIHVTYVLIIALIGFDGRGFDYLAVWVGVATAGILVHELGHALTVRLAGRSPRIDLAGLGGVTTWQPGGRASSRGWLLAVSVAGPGAGLAAAGVAIAAGAPCCAPRAGVELAEYAATTWVFVTLWWSLLNLLPVLPLDGGQALESLLPGGAVARRRGALGVSIVLGVALAVFALQRGFLFGGLLVAWLTWSNVTSFQRLRQAATPAVQAMQRAREAAQQGDGDAAFGHAVEAVGSQGPREVRTGAAEAVLRGHLASDRPSAAMALLEGPAADLQPDPRLVAEVLRRNLDGSALRARAHDLATGGGRHGRAVALLLFVGLGDDDAAIGAVSDGPVVDDVVADVMNALVDAGRVDAAASMGRAVLADGTAEARVAYLTAVALAQVGDVEAAVEHLAGALRLGFDDLELLARDDRLRALRGHPAWHDLQQGRLPKGT